MFIHRNLIIQTKSIHAFSLSSKAKTPSALPHFLHLLGVSKSTKVKRTFIWLLEVNEKNLHIICSRAVSREVNQSASSLSTTDLLELNRLPVLSVKSGA